MTAEHFSGSKHDQQREHHLAGIPAFQKDTSRYPQLLKSIATQHTSN
jgi:hypothetical protein